MLWLQCKSFQSIYYDINFFIVFWIFLRWKNPECFRPHHRPTSPTRRTVRSSASRTSTSAIPRHTTTGKVTIWQIILYDNPTQKLYHLKKNKKFDIAKFNAMIKMLWKIRYYMKDIAYRAMKNFYFTLEVSWPRGIGVTECV